ncbi:hypothetical protein K438DRAFT_1983191 [Mycena galopus ATCC 62051]|nr:hypothetical protein K438DRAFT_1983191 [Mycena galopus ATCC 62051]
MEQATVFHVPVDPTSFPSSVKDVVCRNLSFLVPSLHLLLAPKGITLLDGSIFEWDVANNFPVVQWLPCPGEWDLNSSFNNPDSCFNDPVSLHLVPFPAHPTLGEFLSAIVATPQDFIALRAAMIRIYNNEGEWQQALIQVFGRILPGTPHPGTICSYTNDGELFFVHLNFKFYYYLQEIKNELRNISSERSFELVGYYIEQYRLCHQRVPHCNLPAILLCVCGLYLLVGCSVFIYKPVVEQFVALPLQAPSSNVSQTAAGTRVIGVMKRVRAALEPLHAAGFVRGDVRDVNVLVRNAMSDGSADIILVDWNWAGKEGDVKYHANLHPTVPCVPGAVAGAPISRSHDMNMVYRLYDP